MQHKNNKPYQINYAAHDAVYQRNREKGLPGWDCAEDIAEQIRQLKMIFHHPEILKTGRVLDIGCGAGDISFWLETMGYRVTGIDVSRVAIEWAIEKAGLINSKAEFSIVNVAQNRYRADKLFDIALDNNCLHCIIGKDRKLYLENIHENLRAGGIYICNTMCDDFRDEELNQYFDSESRLLIRNNLAIRYIGKHSDIISEITDAGFKLIYEESTSCKTQDSVCLIAKRDSQLNSL